MLAGEQDPKQRDVSLSFPVDYKQGNQDLIGYILEYGRNPMHRSIKHGKEYYGQV